MKVRITMLKENKFRILMITLFIIYLIGIPYEYGIRNHLMGILGNICLELCICFALFQIKKWRGIVIIYISIFLIGQVIGYVFNLNFLQIYSSVNNGRGISISLASTVIPVILAFIVNFIYQALSHVKESSK
jgi:putative flippase GtrA